MNPERKHFVYWAYDPAGRLLYVGVTSRPDARWRSHRANFEWEHHASRFKMAGPYTRETALARELDEIRRGVPYFNVTHNKGLRAAFALAERELRIQRAGEPTVRSLPLKFDSWWRDRHYRDAVEKAA